MKRNKNMPICIKPEQDRATGLSAGLAAEVMCKYSTSFFRILQLLGYFWSAICDDGTILRAPKGIHILSPN